MNTRDLHRIPGLRTEEGGMSVHSGIAFPLERHERLSDPGENDPFLRASKVSGLTAIAIAAGFVFLLAILAAVLIAKYAPVTH